LPIADQSIAGHVALAKKTVNIRDVYDDAELKAINPSLRFLQEVDKRTGYRTKQMLVAPVVDAQTSELLGVVQIINNKAGCRLRRSPWRASKAFAKPSPLPSLSAASRRQAVKTKYDFLVSDAVISAQELELATRTARRKNLDVEEVLVNEFQVKHRRWASLLASSSRWRTSRSRATESSRWTC
jgi:hypothetical protein